MWDKLLASRRKNSDRHILELFENSNRAEVFSVETDGLYFDYSKTNLDVAQRSLLLSLAEETGVEARRDEMLRGERINTTEDRSVLHTALRHIVDDEAHLQVEGVDVLETTRQTRARMVRFAQAVRDGRIGGAGGAYTDVVNVGIGGSDLGPVMAVRALSPYADGPRCHFIANLDSADLADSLKGLNPATTLVIVASKSFTTHETLTNARAVRDWMAQSVDRPAEQFVAISTALEETEAFGIKSENVFGFEDWVGGRYSVWGPIGLSLILSIGPDEAEAFLRGGLAMDRHFATASPADNMPMMLALIGLWHQKICGYPTRAVIPYEHRLKYLPAYLQQLEMESNGKGVGLDGATLAHGGGPVVWGAEGTNGQHAFFQLLHQEHQVIPVEFLVGAKGHEPTLDENHRALVANCLAQSEALLQGRSLEQARKILINHGKTEKEAADLAPHKRFSGNRPSTTLLYPKLTPFVLGQIIALYEHRVFVEGCVLGLNSFDQWGVELGKEMANDLTGAVKGGPVPKDVSGSTAALLGRLSKPE